MSRTPTEKEIELAFVKRVKAKGGRCLKLAIHGMRGFPDRTVLLPDGELFFVEFKSDRGRLSAQQIVWRKTLQELGFEVFVVSTKADGELLLGD